jgi:type II secretory pathway pseudopilin PulG
MFIELLIVMGILGILATATVVAINPQRHLCEAENAKRRVTAREITNAVNQYAIATARPANPAVPGGEGNAAPICRQGLTDAGCLSLDALVPDYLLVLPVDAAEPNPLLTGYRIYRLTSGFEVETVVPDHLAECTH